MTVRSDKELLKLVGERILLARQALRMSQSELASAIGKTQNVISRYELGNHAMAITELPKLAKALKVSVSYLLGESPIEEDLNLINTFLVSSLRMAATVYLIQNLHIQYSLAKSMAASPSPQRENAIEAVRRVDELMDYERGKLLHQLQASAEQFVYLRGVVQTLFRDGEWIIPNTASGLGLDIKTVEDEQ